MEMFEYFMLENSVLEIGNFRIWLEKFELFLLDKIVFIWYNFDQYLLLQIEELEKFVY